MEIVPALDTKFTKKAELSTFLLIYNAKTDAANKPDVSVEYNFYAKQAGAREVLQQDQSAEPERADAAAAVRFRGRAISCRADRPCRWRRSRKATTGSRSRSPTRSRTRR